MTNISETALFEEWKDVPIGTRVWMCDGTSPVDGIKTCARAILIDGDLAVVELEGMDGYISLSRLRLTRVVDPSSKIRGT